MSGVSKAPLTEEEIAPPKEEGTKEDKTEVTEKEEKPETEVVVETETTKADAPQALYDHALDEIMNKNAKAALPRFVDFVTKYPDHDLTDNAYYWIGECYYSMKRYTDAAENFEKVVVDFPDRDKVPDAMLKLGYSYAESGKKDKAEEVLRNLISIYPKSPAADLARQRLIGL
jgi:tol-pal system protein YbgF